MPDVTWRGRQAVDGGQPMNHSSTTQSWGTLNLSTLKKIGSEYHGPCPVTGAGKDRFWVKPDVRRIGCRGCGHDGNGGLDPTQFKEHLEALGATFGEHDVLLTYDWTNYLTKETVIQTRYASEPKYLWPPRTKTNGLVYLARHDRTAARPLVFCEGAKAASFAASKLPTADYDVIGFVSSTVIPSAGTLTALAKGRPCIIWPDDDEPGEKVARRLVSALRLVAASVVTVDPALLGLTGGHGHDAEQWHPRGSPVEGFRAACGKTSALRAEVSNDTPEQVKLWAEELTNADLDGIRRILRTIAAAPEWQQLAVDLRIEVVAGLSRNQTEKSIATVILGRYDDRTLTWRDPPGEVAAGVEHFRSIWTYAAEATPDVLIPGLAWRGRVSKISAAPKLGKTSLITNGIAAWQAGQTFLGEQTGPPGSVLYVSETGCGTLRAWLEQYGCPSDAPIVVGGAAAVETIAAAAREHKPDLVVIDSLTDLHAASDGGNIWNAGDVRKLLQPLRELGCAVVLGPSRSKI